MLEEDQDVLPTNLVLGGIADEPLGVGEGDIGGSGSVSLVVGDDFHLSVLENSDAGIGGAEIDSNCGFLGHFVQRLQGFTKIFRLKFSLTRLS